MPRVRLAVKPYCWKPNCFLNLLVKVSLIPIRFILGFGTNEASLDMVAPEHLCTQGILYKNSDGSKMTYVVSMHKGLFNK